MNCMKVVNFGWIGHSSSFPICVGRGKADTHWQSGKLWQISISSNLYNCSAPNSGGRWHGGKCGTNLTKAQTGWIFVDQRNFTLLPCSGVSPVFPQLIFQNELHLTLLISHSLCPRATGKCSRERGSYSGGRKAQYILQYGSFAIANQNHRICNPQTRDYYKH